MTRGGHPKGMVALGNVALLSLALLTGNEFCVAAFLEPTLRRLPEAEQVRAVPGFAGILGRFMPPWYAITLLLTLALTIMRYRHGSGLLTGPAVSVGLQFVVLAVTLALLVPRNTRLARMTAAYSTWRADAQQWDRLHQMRVALLFMATVALTMA